MSFRVSRSGDGGLERFAAGLQSVAAGAWKEPTTEAVAEACEELLHEQFSAGIDPEGNAWAGTKRGNAPPLTAGGALSGSARAVPGPDDLTILVQITDHKAPWHQYGTKRGASSPGALPSDHERRGHGWKGRADVARKTSNVAEGWHVPPRQMLPMGTTPARWVARIEAKGGKVFLTFLEERLAA